jgi:hypothetical protein
MTAFAPTSRMSGTTQHLAERLDALRTELADLAFTLESRGRLDAADVAITISARVGELCEELGPARLDPGEGDFQRCVPAPVLNNGVR